MGKPKLKVSWSILNSWDKGYKDQALKQLAGLQTPANTDMKTGLECHAYIAENRINTFLFKGAKVKLLSDEAIYEDRSKGINYYKASINEWLDISGQIDVIDPTIPSIFDWKTGGKTSSEQNEMQVYIYSYLHWLCSSEDIKYGVMAKVHKDKDNIILEDYSVYKINNSKLEKAHDFIETVGLEIYQLYEANDYNFNFVK